MEGKAFYRSIFPSAFIALLMGFSPMFIKSVNNRYSLQTSKYLYIINITYQVVFTLLILRTINDSQKSVMSNNYYQKNRVSNIGIAFVFVGGVSSFYTIYIFGFAKTESIKCTINRFADVDKTLQKLGLTMGYLKSFMYQCITQVFIIIFVSTISALQRENIHREHLREISLITWILLIYPVVLIAVLQNHFSCTVLLIYYRFKLINKLLRNMNTKSTIVLNKVKILQKVHAELCEISFLTCINYNVQTLVNLVVQYGICLFALFYSYWMFKEKPFSASCWLLWATLKFSEILHITVSCHLASKEANSTKDCVHKLLLKTNLKETNRSLIEFSHQLLHHKVRFTAVGILTLDATLLFIIISSAATYMVIMLQFQQASIPTTCKLDT